MCSLLSSRLVRFVAIYLSLVMLSLLCMPAAVPSSAASSGRHAAGNLPNIDVTRKQQPAAPRPIPEETTVAPTVAENVAGSGSILPMMFQSGQDPEFATARNRPQNRTGEAGVSLGSRNYNWSLPLVNLAGRAGMDLDLTLHYNSLVWTKQGMNTGFNLNKGFPNYHVNGHRAPGFELHLPFIQQRYTNQDYGGFAFLMISPSGGRVEFRQVGTSNVYEAADGSYAQLVDNGTAGATMRTTDGTLYTFGWVEIFQPQFGPAQVRTRRCTEIKDRNGNIITATYSSSGAITSITDTLGRVLTFNYTTTAPFTLNSITQTRNGSTYTLASFSYGNQPYVVNFVTPDSGNNNNGSSTTVLTQVTLPDGSYYTFQYNGYVQVYRITHYAADGHVLAYTNYNLPMDNSVPQADCPRFTERRQWIENGVMNTSQEILTTYSSASDGSWSQTTAPDANTTYKEYFYTTGWQKGLPYLSEVWHGGVRKKWTTSSWTQDDVSLTYQKNPRVYDSTTEDAEGNRSRVDITFGVGYSLPTEVREYSQDGSGYAGFLRRTYYTYNLSQPYLDRRIIGLIESVNVIDENNNYAHRLTYEYDRGGEYLANTPAAATQHDGANFSTGFVVGRGNRTDIWQWDANDPMNAAKAIRLKHIGYNINGSVVFSRDALNHQKTFGYTDSFSDGINRNTLAFPTTATDEDNFSSTVQHDYNSSLVTRTQDPKGAIEVTTYDSADRMLQTTNQFNGAYSRFVYPTSHNIVQRYSTLQSGAGEAYSADYMDGWGRLRATITDHPGSVGGYSATMTWYDAMGRAVQQTNPTEINASWATVGDDAAGWVWTYQTYDWAGRPLVTTNPDSSTRENVYSGCGCAGSSVTTFKDERGRRRRVTKDTLGRLKRVEELNWNQSVYATTNYTFNGRDQVTSTNQAGQPRSLNYDGYGRLQSRTTPEQGTATFTYFADGSMASASDARGASQTYTYNNRHLITGITFGVPGGVAATPNISIGYDSAGNKTSMNDGLGSMTYVYNTISELTSETRNFTGLGSYTLTYGYNLAGQLNSITNPWSAQVGYNYDKIGRVTNVTGSGYMGVSSYVNSLTYRTFGLKQMAYNNGRTLSVQYDNRMRPTQWNIPGVLGWNYAYHYFGENTGRVMYAQNINDGTLDRSYDYDHLGRLTSAHSGGEARSHMGIGPGGVVDGPYSQRYFYDVWGNITSREGWGGDNPNYGTVTYTNNKRAGLTYDAAGNVTNDGGQNFTYDATGQSATSSYTGYTLQNSYDGNQLRGKKVDGGVTTYYLRSSVLGGRVVAEINGAGTWQRGYVYLGSELVALQQSGVYWMHQDSVAKSTRVTNNAGTVVSTVELDPWGGNTNRNNNDGFQPRRFATYERDGNASDEAMNRRYNRWWSRFDQPDPYEGSYDAGNPQSFNRYTYVQNDPVNFIDPSGLCVINIQITGVALISAETLAAAQAELSRIFGQAGQTVLFNSSGGSIRYHINLANVNASTLPTAMGSTRPTFGSTTAVDNYGAAYPNRIDGRNAQRESDRTLALHPVNRGTAIGRVIAHETGHYLLQMRGHSRSGLMRPQFTRDETLFRRGGNNDSPFHFTDAQREQINALCRGPITTDTAVPNNFITPRPLRGDSGIPNRRVLGTGGGVRVGGIGPLSWLEWLYGPRQQGRTEIIDPRRFRF